jgi:hypothetical protein
MSYSLGIAIVVLVAEQNVILQTSLFTAGMLRSQQPRRRAAEQAVDFCRQIKGSSDFLCAGSNCKIEQSRKDFGGIRAPSLSTAFQKIARVF